MRFVQVAKILGISGQDLRKELSQVDFGVKPTDREVPDNLAMGVIRFVANKRGITIDWKQLEIDRLGGSSLDAESDADAPSESAPAAPVAPSAPVPVPEKPKTENLNVMRKLTLDGVSKEAIDREKLALAREQFSRKTAVREAEQKMRSAHPAIKKDRSVHQEQIKQKTGPISIPSQISVKEFAEKAGVQVPKVISALMKNGVLANINQQIDFDTASIVAMELGMTLERQESTVSVEALLKNDLAVLTKEEDASLLLPRAPIVTVMGHVDHGKTAILDAVRSTDVVSGEAGGITQHIGAYQVKIDGRPITFIDTPGHEAFTAMRARGAQLTDIVVLVVSAEEGVKPTTIEAIAHAKEAGVPIVVAINKIDRPNADIERVKGELAGHDLQAEDWGGSVPMVPCSAHTKKGIPELLTTILLVADLEDLKANPHRSAIATVVESHLDRSRGPLATVIVNTGTLLVGDIVGSGAMSGRVKALLDEHGKRITQALPSAPAVISGFDALPSVGDILQVFSTDRELKAYLTAYQELKAREVKHGFSDLVTRLSEGKLKELKVILKVDAQGSLESLIEAMKKLATEKVHTKIIHAAVGDISESDVMMASASGALIVGFHTDTPGPVQRTADREGVAIRHYTIIYKLLEEMELLLDGLIEPTEEEKIFGHLEVRGVFFTKGSEQIIGGRVTDGIIKRIHFRLLRGEEVVGTGRITSLKNIDKDIKEAKEGAECGMRVTSSVPVLEGDVLEVFAKEFTKKIA